MQTSSCPRSLAALLVVTGLGGCCPELRETVLRGDNDAKPADGDTRSFTFTAPDCFDANKELLLGVLWRSGKQKATASLNGREVATIPEQTCDLLNQAIEALGGAVTAAVSDAIGDPACYVHLVQGPELSADDAKLVSTLKADKFTWQLLKLPKGVAKAGANTLDLKVADSSESCVGEDKRPTSRVGYVLVSDVDNACDKKFKT